MSWSDELFANSIKPIEQPKSVAVTESIGDTQTQENAVLVKTDGALLFFAKPPQVEDLINSAEISGDDYVGNVNRLEISRMTIQALLDNFERDVKRYGGIARNFYNLLAETFPELKSVDNPTQLRRESFTITPSGMMVKEVRDFITSKLRETQMQIFGNHESQLGVISKYIGVIQDKLDHNSLMENFRYIIHMRRRIANLGTDKLSLNNMIMDLLVSSGNKGMLAFHDDILHGGNTAARYIMTPQALPRIYEIINDTLESHEPYDRPMQIQNVLLELDAPKDYFADEKVLHQPLDIIDIFGMDENNYANKLLSITPMAVNFITDEIKYLQEANLSAGEIVNRTKELSLVLYILLRSVSVLNYIMVGVRGCIQLLADNALEELQSSAIAMERLNGDRVTHQQEQLMAICQLLSHHKTMTPI